MYFIEKNITRLRNHQPTFFLDPKELRDVQSKLKKDEYSIYSPYLDSEKKILYTDLEPEVLLYEIKCKSNLRHQDILGSMYSLNIDKGLFGDILLIDHHYYIYILSLVRNYFESNFLRVKNTSVELSLVELDTLKNYERSYVEEEYIVSSLRIDTLISAICHTNRSNINSMISKKEILLNYDFLKNSSYILKEDDVFSIKRIGKYRFVGIIKNTKRNHYIVKVLKYV